MSGRYLRFKIDVKSAKNDHSWVIFGASTPQHDLILVVLYVRSKVHFMNKLLSYGKDRVTVGEFRDICILKMVNFCPREGKKGGNHRSKLKNSTHSTLDTTDEPAPSRQYNTTYSTLNTTDEPAPSRLFVFLQKTSFFATPRLFRVCSWQTRVLSLCFARGKNEGKMTWLCWWLS